MQTKHAQIMNLNAVAKKAGDGAFVAVH